MISIVKNCSYPFANKISYDTYISLSVVFLFIFAWTYLKVLKKTPLLVFSFFLVIIGGGFNIYQRISLGCVTDYINFFGLFYFNIWDVMVSVGLILLFIHVLKEDI